jgi:hypothetical protein
MTVNQEEVTTAIAVGRSVAQGDDAEAAEATVRLARRAGPDAVRFLRHIVRAERGVSIPQQVRAACALLEVGRFLGPSAEARSTEALRGQAGADGRAEAGETS